MHQKAAGLRFSARELAATALFAALTAVFTQIAIPTQPIPFTLGYLAVMLCVATLPLKLSFFAMATYLMLGLVGVPVFSGFQGGFQRLIGPTGGYLVGYLFFALVSSSLLGRRRGTAGPLHIAGALFAGMCACDLCAMLWLMVSLGYSLTESFLVGVFPYLAFNLIKLAAAVAVSLRLRKALARAGFAV